MGGMIKLSSFLLSLMAIAAFGIPLPCRADTTETVLSNCRDVAKAKVTSDGVMLNPNYESGYCMGAFAVVAQMLMAVDSATHKPLFGVCLNSHHTRTQLIAVFVRYAEKHPERYNEDFPWVAFDAAKEAFPCPK